MINASEYLETVEQIKTENQAVPVQGSGQRQPGDDPALPSIGEIINSHKIWGNRFIDSLARRISNPLFFNRQADGLPVRRARFYGTMKSNKPAAFSAPGGSRR